MDEGDLEAMAAARAKRERKLARWTAMNKGRPPDPKVAALMSKVSKGTVPVPDPLNHDAYLDEE